MNGQKMTCVSRQGRWCWTQQGVMPESQANETGPRLPEVDWLVPTAHCPPLISAPSGLQEQSEPEESFLALGRSSSNWASVFQTSAGTRFNSQRALGLHSLPLSLTCRKTVPMASWNSHTDQEADAYTSLPLWVSKAPHWGPP